MMGKTTLFGTLLAFCLSVSGCTVSVDTDETPAGTDSIPRTPSGRPNMNGIWQALGNAHWNIEPHMASAALATIPGPMGPVPATEVLAFGAVGAVPSGQGIVVGGEIPYLPEALDKCNENRANWLERDPEIRCYLPGVPRATYMQFPFQVFQSDAKFMIAYEYASAVRDVYLEDPGPPQVDSWMGQSVGHWEGDTFVIEVSGLHHIQYEATIEDPQTFSQPWTIRLPLYRNIDPDARLGQFKCVEFVEELIYGHLRKNPIER